MEQKDVMVLGLIAAGGAAILLREKLLLWVGITGGAYAVYHFLLKPKKSK